MTALRVTQMTLHQQSRSLEVGFSDGSRYQLPCEYLRVYSPSAEVRGHFGVGAKLVTGKQGVNITEIRPVGQYAVKIVFDDGHDSGLFDWDYLHKLGKQYGVLWTQYLDRCREAGIARSSA
ncbi:MAG: DUF971 domain-containing protein [Gammaproteobacteria bacterium SHHR-1]|uniref:gamma-butyrobetaine hydroxylase-like domain-containing protein n=1 Tax=Magnetovirga frankeli TaxID=947516 RepID=UPI001293B0A8|nr:DUF971 domain-containing protein [gamma proteobacterium SS-5]